MNRQVTQFSVMAVVGALAVVALFAVAFFAANGAQAENVTTNALPYESGNGGTNAVLPQRGGKPTPEPTAEPTPTPVVEPAARVREGCATDPADAITGGAHALFDVYWDTDDQNLVNNPCPPSVSHHVEPGSVFPPVISTVRTPSDINIESTVIHMPEGLQLEVVLQGGPRDGQDGTYAVPKNSALWQAYPEGDANKHVWLLPEWEPEVPGQEEDEEHELIHIGFSAGLLDPDDWAGDIEWNYETLREPEVAVEDRGVVLVTEDRTFRIIDWDSRDPDVRRVTVPPGEYEHRSWAFTKPGTYFISAHVKGRLAGSPPGTSKTSEVTHYIFHAGSLADLNVAVSVDDEAPEAGGVVTYTVNAGNAGPDTAPHGEVKVSLPEGLTYNPADTRVNGLTPAENAVKPSNEGRTLTWQVGEMAKDYSATLSFKANVGGGTQGQALEVTAKIGARENIGEESEVLQLDPREADNSSTVTITPTGSVNRPPLFNLEWSVREDATPATLDTPGTLVGSVKAVDPNEQDDLFYSLDGEGHQNFMAVATDDGVEIRVAARTSLDYEAGPRSYNLVLGVTDTKDPAGVVDGKTDDTIGLMIAVTNVVESASEVTFSVDPTEQVIGQTATFTMDTLGELPEGADNVTVEFRGPNGEAEFYRAENVTGFPVTWALTGSGDPGSREYNAALFFDLDGKSVHYRLDPVTVNWTAAE